MRKIEKLERRIDRRQDEIAAELKVLEREEIFLNALVVAQEAKAEASK